MSLLGSLPPMIGLSLYPAGALFGSICAVIAGKSVVVGLDDLPVGFSCIDHTHWTITAFPVLPHGMTYGLELEREDG